MRRAKHKNRKDDSIFELLSDLSLSVLGLFLIFFVIYSLIFNFKNLALLDRERNAQRQIEEFKRQVTELSEKVSKLSQEVREAKQRNQYTGFYTGTEESRYYYGYCFSSSYENITNKISIFYIQESNIAVYSISSEKGTSVYRYSGTLSVNVFTGSYTDYSRSPGIESCDRNSNELVIEFFADRLEFYRKGSSSRTSLRKERS
ncbi:hypothetical protein [Kamptonema formosum]|uniref:hypothetical protein n=1 Tax=Kamptonema formosum TaxID=331992 RepID=UPI00035CFA5A|nr:hypothetical protein [Oscillatoria sp. PCC 10802]